VVVVVDATAWAVLTPIKGTTLAHIPARAAKEMDFGLSLISFFILWRTGGIVVSPLYILW
jgi:hypothetical protein